MNKLTCKKMNMSQIFLDTGKVVAVTLIKSETEVTSELENKNIVVSGISKGKGFAGAMKKWHYHGEEATRGQSTKPRGAGAVGSQTPKNVIKGKKMAGRMGGDKVTIKGLKIVRVLPDLNQFMVSGPVPGARNTPLEIQVL